MDPLLLALLSSLQTGPDTVCGRTGADGEPGKVVCEGQLAAELDDVVQLAFSGTHACTLHPDHTVSCWGANSDGQAGVDGPRRVETPTRLEWLAERGDVVALSVGGRFSCATLKKKAETVCWGKLRTHPLPPPQPRTGGGGVLGGIYGADPPVVVHRLEGPKGLVQHDGGGGFACGRREEGSVVCWGALHDDPAGYGVVEQPISDAVHVEAGRDHACALDEAGAVWCWRSNEQGQLGNGGVADQLGPVRVTGLPAADALSVGADHSCAHTAKGEVWCWGDRAFGAVGDGLARGAARRAVQVEGLPRTASVDASRTATCATAPGEAPWCWGGGRYAPRIEGTVVQVPLEGVVDVAAGDGHTCARTADDALWCWGGREVRGTPGATDGGTPRRVAEGVIDVAAGKDHACFARNDGSVSCWGDGGFGQLDGEHEGRASPVRVHGPPFVDMAVGRNTTCARDGSGTVWCWGDGGTTVGSRIDRAQASPTPVHALGPGTLHVGANHSCTLADGVLSCVGEPWDGALGVERDEETLAPIAAPVDGLRSVVVRGSRTCGIRDDRSLWCWGGWSHDDVTAEQLLPVALGVAVGSYGEGCAITDEAGHVACWGDLGPPFTEDGEQVEEPMQLEGVEGIVEVVMGDDHACGRHRDGTVTCWGRWRGGQGYARPWPARTPKQLPLEGVVQLVAGGNHTCARTEGGDVWCWGASDKGQVGHGARERQPTPAQLPLSGIEQLASEGSHTCARSSEATWCWGDNTYGQLGHGAPETDRLLPEVVPFVSDAVAVTAGYTASCATAAHGTHTCWGRDVYRDTYSFQGEQPFSPPASGLRDLTLGGADVGCALADDRTQCWGEPLFGALGPDGPEGDERMGGLEGAARQVTVGDSHGCVLLQTGDVVCFGANHRGQCGVEDAETVERHTVLQQAISVSAGEHHTCAAGSDGKVRCWGDNEQGQLGRDGDGSHEPTVVLGVEGVVAVTAGWNHTCARTKGQRLLCWGDDDRGQLGRGAPYENHRPWQLVSPSSPTRPAPSR